MTWQPEVREAGRWVRDENPYSVFFAESLHGLDVVRIVELLAATGVCYLPFRPDPVRFLKWEVLSASELIPAAPGKAPLVRRNRYQPPEPLWDDNSGEKPGLLRVHRSDLEYSGEAWAPILAVQPHLEALRLMVLAEQALDQSRLAGAGVFFLPDSIAFPDMLPADEANKLASSPTFRRIVKSMIEPISDRSSIDAVVPIVITGPAEDGDRIKHFMLERRDDPAGWALRRDSHLREIARALDLPAGRVLNTDDQAKFANASSISDEIVDVFLPRFLHLPAAEITEHVYQPILERWGVPDPHLRRIAPCLDDLVPDEDRTDEALRLYDAGVLSRKGLARMARIADEDFIGDGSAEYHTWLAEQRVRGRAPQPVQALPAGTEDYGAVPVSASLNRVLQAVERPMIAAVSHVVLPRPVDADDVEPDWIADMVADIETDMARTAAVPSDVSGIPTAEVLRELVAAELDRLGYTRVAAPATEAPAWLAPASRPEPFWFEGANWKTRTELADRLNAIDERAAAELHGLCENALENALAKAGSRVLGPTRSQAIVAALKAVEPVARVATAGRAHVAALGLTEQDLLADAFDSLAGDADRVLLDAHAAVSRELGPMSPAAADTDEWRRRAVAALTVSMGAVARERLYDPSPSFDPRGELPEISRTVPPAVVRRTLGLAGGAPDTANLPVGGLASGDGTLGPLTRSADGPRAQWRWVHNPGLRPFPAHARLGGLTFETPFDDRLNLPADSAWIGFRHASPGDHPGCRCQLILELI